MSQVLKTQFIKERFDIQSELCSVKFIVACGFHLRLILITRGSYHARWPLKTPTRTPTKTPIRTPNRTPTRTLTRTPTRTPMTTPIRTPTRTL